MIGIDGTSSTQLSPSLYLLPGTSQSPPALGGYGASPSLIQDAVSLSFESLLVGGSATASTLLQSFDQAGTAASAPVAPPADLPAPAAAAASLNQSIVDSLAASPGNSGVYTAQGVVQSLPPDVSGNWATVLLSQPALAATVAGDSSNQDIVAGLSVYA
jgi:hypothetical protein